MWHMGRKKIGGQYYYSTMADADRHRRSGERVYFAPGLGYYIVRPRKRDIWERLFR